MVRHRDRARPTAFRRRGGVRPVDPTRGCDRPRRVEGHRGEGTGPSPTAQEAGGCSMAPRPALLGRRRGLRPRRSRPRGDPFAARRPQRLPGGDDGPPGSTVRSIAAAVGDEPDQRPRWRRGVPEGQLRGARASPSRPVRRDDRPQAPQHPSYRPARARRRRDPALDSGADPLLARAAAAGAVELRGAHVEDRSRHPDDRAETRPAPRPSGRRLLLVAAAGASNPLLVSPRVASTRVRFPPPSPRRRPGHPEGGRGCHGQRRGQHDRRRAHCADTWSPSTSFPTSPSSSSCPSRPTHPTAGPRSAIGSR